jgi:hypothetical protein
MLLSSQFKNFDRPRPGRGRKGFSAGFQARLSGFYQRFTKVAFEEGRALPALRLKIKIGIRCAEFNPAGD